jgi:hypothetical protein
MCATGENYVMGNQSGTYTEVLHILSLMWMFDKHHWPENRIIITRVSEGWEIGWIMTG